MLYLEDIDDEWIAEQRGNDPHGRSSNNDLERQALIRRISRAIEGVENELIRDILETMMDVLT